MAAAVGGCGRGMSPSRRLYGLAGALLNVADGPILISVAPARYWTLVQDDDGRKR
jgi:hypothetical protein